MKLECLYAPHQWRENETWINECADKGLHIEKWENAYAAFSENSDFNFQYWIDVDNGGPTPNAHRRKELEQLGYKYVTSAQTGYFHVYRAPKGTPDIPENKKLRKQAGLLYDALDWLIIPFYTFLFAFNAISCIRILLTPELLMEKNTLFIVMGLSLSLGMFIQCLRELWYKIRLVVDLSKPAVHERVILKAPKIKYSIVAKYGNFYFFIFFALSILLDMMK